MLKKLQSANEKIHNMEIELSRAQNDAQSQSSKVRKTTIFMFHDVLNIVQSYYCTCIIL